MHENHTVARLRSEGSLGFGAAPIGNLYRAVSDEVARAAVESAWQHGIRHYDVAPHYGLGAAERRLGEVLSGQPRDSYLLSSKVGRLLRPNPAPQGRDPEGFDVPDNLTRVFDYSRDGVLRSIEESLKRLGTDRLDVVYIHDPDEHWEEAISGAVPALAELRNQGVIGAYGAGMNQSAMLERFVRESDLDVVMLAGRYTLLEQSDSRSLIAACRERGVGIVDVGVFNSGLLSKDRPAADATYNYAPAPAGMLERANALADLAEKHGTTLPAVALAFPYQEPAVVSVVLGMRTAEQVEQNVQLRSATIPDQFWQDAAALGYIS
ncbi:aldo/keto reductase [Arthrobacter sunyaminii]|uniref:aldo/keto reductase n=1 Tax=Arthrobacter sunyaminii TaxID=2816859 RepID=UPI001A942AC0|nr:aldo/keto reductase [Arthrobacter sunyaminii]MBO0896207.1 aldo/keto reductase [Arthrobacter sunyaminii]